MQTMETAVYRMIDANFNRAREAMRLMEEYCRFALNSTALTGRAKQLRHRLSGAVAGLDARLLAVARDSRTDVGREMRISDQMTRDSLADCLTAAAKRLSEALRVLAESTRLIDTDLADLFETLRFDAYTLEKDIVLAATAYQRFRTVRLYVLITAGPDDSHDRILQLARQCARGGADCLQLRAKGINDGRLFDLAAGLVGLCRDSNIISIINDRVDIAVAAGADGVHLGQNDLPVTEVAKLQKTPMITGISTHSLGQLDRAIAQGAGYAALGPVFATATKPQEPAVGLDYVAAATERLRAEAVCHVAIGGITPANIADVLRAGARAVAVCSAVTAQADPAAQCRRLKDAIHAVSA